MENQSSYEMSPHFSKCGDHKSLSFYLFFFSDFITHCLLCIIIQEATKIRTNVFGWGSSAQGKNEPRTLYLLCNVTREFSRNTLFGKDEMKIKSTGIFIF
ncbi:uncharacterized protein LY89DRAFT_686524 [Mollisia scopiformis]|uniref:Uncharacterized protein n=1 Tax=Mollisia scopiformis TaxID=149040 RepID=A0A194X552_MOLSC|nr:uncharacterized protein LY89DRAFT_686524 [Mollisia scopiformis]KUJ14927.1 hypothetical protein LY89DRAFT_686524 [Mollisia scopiformis]